MVKGIFYLLVKMEQQRFTFKKHERLCSRITIEALFTKGKSFVKYPFRVTYLKLNEPVSSASAQVLISVSKKRFKRAYKRNRLKRLTREAYRLNKSDLVNHLNHQGHNYAIAFIYLPTEILDYNTVEKGVKKALKTIIRDTTTND